MDFLDSSAGQAIASKRPILKAARDRKVSQDDVHESGFKVDKTTGKLIITDDGSKKEDTIASKCILVLSVYKIQVCYSCICYIID